MQRKCRLKLESPYGKADIEADSMTELAKMASVDIPRLIWSIGLPGDGQCPQIDAETLLRAYKSKHCRNGNRARTRLEMAGFELDLVNCYLQGMKIVEAAEWMRENKSFVTSASAVARYWKKFGQIVRPAHK